MAYEQNKLLVNGQHLAADALIYVLDVPYGQLRAIFQAIGGTVVWQSSEAQAVVFWRNNVLIVPSIGKVVTLNGQRYDCERAPRAVAGRLWVSLGDLARLFSGGLRAEGYAWHLLLSHGWVIALDAGHGGRQPGAVGTSGVLEKDLARQVVDLLLPRLRLQGARVVDIRPGDEQVSLALRVRRSLINEADLFISVHYNAHERDTANGTETFHAVGNVAALRLAGLVQEELVGTLGLRDRGVKQAAFQVLRSQMKVAAVLVEVGFLTNPLEESFLVQPSTIHKTAEALHRAITRFIS